MAGAELDQLLERRRGRSSGRRPLRAEQRPALQLRLGDRHAHRREQQLQHRGRVVAEPAVAVARIGARHPRAEHRRQAECERRVRRVERRHAAVPEARRRAEDPGPGADDDRLPAEPARRGVEPADQADRLVLAAVSGPGGDVAAQQAQLAQLAHVARQRARQRRARSLEEADAQARPRLGRGPGHRRQVAVQRDHQRRRLRAEVRLAVLDLDRLDRVLERRVVELDHVHALLAVAEQPAGEVDVDDVEAARAEPEVARPRVDHDLVADLHRRPRASCPPRPGDARRRRRPSAGRPPRRCRGAASARPAHPSVVPASSAIASQTASISSSRDAATLSCGVWLASVPFASSTASKPRSISAFASLPPPVATSRASIRQRSSAALARRTGGALDRRR